MQIWRESPLVKVNAVEAERDADVMRKTMLKLYKRFDGLSIHDPRSVAGEIARELDVFCKEHVPLLSLLCTPGLKDRHWDTIMEITGLRIFHAPGSNLEQMLGYGLEKHVDGIEETCVNANKEYGIEKAFDKMEQEWEGIQFECKAYRNSGTYILASVDEIQQILDDQIVKTQAMRGSRYIKALIGRLEAWEKTLVDLQVFNLNFLHQLY
jgi:dynein heavy chain